MVLEDIFQHDIDLKIPQVDRIANYDKLKLDRSNEVVLPIHEDDETGLSYVDTGIDKQFVYSHNVYWQY